MLQTSNMVTSAHLLMSFATFNMTTQAGHQKFHQLTVLSLFAIGQQALYHLKQSFKKIPFI